MHHFKNGNNRHHIKLCSTKGKIFSQYTFPNMEYQEVLELARDVWSKNFIMHNKWLEIADKNGEVIFTFNNIK
jgi:hypothetical protein